MVHIVRRKKGRPSKADLAARQAAEAASDLRRSLRRRSAGYAVDSYDEEDGDDGDDEEEEEAERRREKKLKQVLKLPLLTGREYVGGGRRRREASGGHALSASSSENKTLKRSRIGGDAESAVAVDCDYEYEEEENGDFEEDEERGRGERRDSKGADSVPGTPLDPQSGIPLPDKKSLELILDKLQKKDTYGVYAEPVDPEELPDYHDIIENPMDFATVRKKLGSGLYSMLEQFEADVLLICSNAMQYNAPETIYYKQANSIQELARKKFERLRVEIERSEKELKSEQRTRSNSLAKKQIKKPVGRSAQDQAGSDFSSSATLAMAGEGQNGLIATQASCERPNNTDAVVEGNCSQVDTNLEKTEELFSGKILPSKYGKKSAMPDENRRTTYSISEEPIVRSEPVFSILEGEDKQLVAVGLQAEYSYARSLSRFAATLGPVAWKVASKRIEQVLPAGFKFGHGWVGEYEPLPTAVFMLERCVEREPASVTRLQCVADMRTDGRSFKSAIPAKENFASGRTVECKSAFVSSIEHKPATTLCHSGKQHSLLSKDTLEPKTLPARHVELNHPPSANQSTSAAGKPQLPSGPDMAGPRTKEEALRSKNLLQCASFKQPYTNGVVGGMPNGKVMSNKLDDSVKVSSSSDSVPKQIARPAAYFPHGQGQGFSDPVQVMKMLAEQAQKQQNSSSHAAVDTKLAVPSAPSVRRDNYGNAWTSVSAGDYRPNIEYSSAHRNQISADSLYNPTREFYSPTVRPQGEFPVSGSMPFQSEKNGFLLQPFVPQPVRMRNEAQFQNRPSVIPQFVTDLSRFQEPPLRGHSPHNQQRQKQETLPPDLNIGFHSSNSPVRQPSGVLVESQQPDLALQL